MSRSLTLVLEGNNPRFSWEPSATMLTNRLSGTTEISVSNRIGRGKSGGSSSSPHVAGVDLVDSTIFLHHGERAGPCAADYRLSRYATNVRSENPVAPFWR
jgi:hypothetical protein